MKRREIIKLAALATGTAISAPLLTSLFSSCSTEITPKDVDYTLQFFTQEELMWVRDFVDVILPKSDSPSAADMKVHQMIDSMVGKVYNQEDQAKYKKGFDALKQFLEKSPQEEKVILLQKLENSEDAALSVAKEAYLDIKQQTVAYYLSTEEIAKTYLNYLPVPGEYQSCISVEEAGGKVWAL